MQGANYEAVYLTKEAPLPRPGRAPARLRPGHRSIAPPPGQACPGSVIRTPQPREIRLPHKTPADCEGINGRAVRGGGTL